MQPMVKGLILENLHKYLFLKDILPRKCFEEFDMSSRKYLTLSQRQQLEKSLQQNLPSTYSRRIQIMLLADEGKSQAEICRILGCTNTTASHWLVIGYS